VLEKLNRQFAAENPGESALSARLRAYELAAKMQASIPEAIHFADETAETHKLYGLDDPKTAGFGRNCLLARRLLERGVRFVQLYNGGALGSPRINWDAHEDVKQNHDTQAALRPALAGLAPTCPLRTPRRYARVLVERVRPHPFTEGVGARTITTIAFTCWLAGAGLKQGFKYGATDEVGYMPAENPVTVYDLHATILHLLGIDHTRLTYYHNGIARRLTDVHGHVIEGVLA
jgi:hypothetical protein